jgi:uncharacterized membrane protein
MTHDTRQAAGAKQDINVGEIERAASGAIGGYLMLKGLRAGSLGGLTMMGAGTALLFRAFTGYCGMYAALGINTAKKGKKSDKSLREDVTQSAEPLETQAATLIEE